MVAISRTSIAGACGEKPVNVSPLSNFNTKLDDDRFILSAPLFVSYVACTEISRDLEEASYSLQPTSSPAIIKECGSVRLKKAMDTSFVVKII